MEGSSVIRQETFDVDPALTLRSRSGGVKRGSIALPIIGADTYASTPPIKEASFESVEGELQTKLKTKAQKGKIVSNARPSTYILNAEVNDQQKHLSSNELNGGNPKQSSNKFESKKQENKNIENVRKISDNTDQKTHQNSEKEKVHILDKNRYEDVDSLDKKTKRDSNNTGNQGKKVNKPTVSSNPGDKSDTKIKSVDSENKDKNQVEVSTLKKENKNTKQPNKGSKDTEPKKETPEKSPKNDKTEKSPKTQEKSDKKSFDQQSKSSKPKEVEVKDKSLVQSSVRDSNDTAPRGNNNVLKNNQTLANNKNKVKLEGSTPPKDNKSAAGKTLPVSENQVGSQSVSESNKDTARSSGGQTDSEIEKNNITDRSVKTKNPVSKSNVKKTEINQIKQKEDQSVRRNVVAVKEKNHRDSSQDSKSRLPNRTATSNRVVDNHEVTGTSDTNKRPSKGEDSPRKDIEIKENNSSRQVKFDIDASGNDGETFSVNLTNFAETDYNSFPPKSTSLAEEHTKQNPAKSTENAQQRETKTANNENVNVESDLSKTNKTVISSKRSSQDNKVSVLKTDKKDDSQSQNYLRPSEKESNISGKTSPNSVYRGRSPKPVDSLSINRYSASPDKHFHGNSHIYSPEKPYYDEKHSRRSVMESPARQPEASESYAAVYAERKTLLDAEVTYKKRIKQLEDELNQFLRTIDDLRAENKILRSKIDDLERPSKSEEGPVNHQSKNTVVIDTEKKGLEGKIKDLDREKKELNQRLEESGTKVNLAMSENKQLSDKYEEVFWKNKELEEKCSELENRLRSMKEEPFEEQDDTGSPDKVNDENEILKKNLEKLTFDIEKANKDSKSVSEENEKLKSELKNNNDIKGQLESKQKELEASQKDEARAKSQFEKLKLDFEQMKLDGDEAKNKEIEKLKTEVVNLKMELKRMEAEKEKYKELTTPRLDDGEGKPSPNTETMTLKSQVISLQTENQSLNEEIIKMKAEHLETVKKMHDLEKTAKSFEKSVTDVESEKLSQIQDLQNDNSRLKAENKSLNENLNQKKVEIQELMTAMKDDKFEDEIKQAKEDKEQSKKELEGKANELDTVRKEMEEFKTKYDTLEKEKKKEDENVLALSKINDEKKKEIDDLKAKVDKLNKDLEKEQEKSNSLQESEKDIADAKSQVSKLEKDIENLKIKHEKEIKHLKNVNNQENEEWRKKYISLEKENKEEISHLKSEIERLKAEIAKLEGLREAAKDLEDTRKDLLLLQGRVSDLTIELEQRTNVDERNFELSLKIETLNKKIRELEMENKNLSVDKEIAGDFESSNKKLSNENKKLRFQLDEHSVDQKMEILERKQKDNETRVRQLEGWVGDLYEEKPEPNTSKRRPKKQPFSKAEPTLAGKKSKKPRSLEEVNVKVEEDKVTTHSSTPSLPNIFENEKKPLTFGLGYSQIYRNRLKTVSKYKKS